jgi:hypothetical protein
MTVQQLIDLLGTIPDKNMPIFAYACEDVNIEDPNWIDSIDLTISDRIDLNIRAINSKDMFEVYG